MDKIEFRGRQVPIDYPERHRIAQEQKTYDDFGDGKIYERIPHTDDEGRHCHDCYVDPGELHLPGCDAEECPMCHGQAISCDCPHEE